MTNDTHEEPLSGGNVSAGVVRVGDTVRRPTGPWTPAVHAFLRHLEAAGFDGAPRVLGIDERGREILEYIPGVVPWPPGPYHEHLGSDEAVWKAGRLLRGLHDASGSFRPPHDAVWREPERADDALPFADERGLIVCHNDPTAWNLVVGEGRWAFIDWDFAGPRPFMWDVTYALIGFLPVNRNASAFGWSASDPVPFGSRLRAFGDGYGLAERDRARLADMVVTRIASSHERGRVHAAAGIEPWATLWNEGHGEGWADMLAFATEQRADWERALR